MAPKYIYHVRYKGNGYDTREDDEAAVPKRLWPQALKIQHAKEHAELEQRCKRDGAKRRARRQQIRAFKQHEQSYYQRLFALGLLTEIEFTDHKIRINDPGYHGLSPEHFQDLPEPPPKPPPTYEQAPEHKQQGRLPRSPRALYL